MSNKVSDMVKMYSQSRPPANTPPPRQWQTGGAGTRPPPPTAPKPSATNFNGQNDSGRPVTAPRPFGVNSAARNDNNTPSWKKDLENRRINTSGIGIKPQETSQENIPAWKRRMLEQKEMTEKEPDSTENKNIPAWKRELEAKTEKNKETNNNVSSWKKKEENTKPINTWSAPKPNVSASPPIIHKKPPQIPNYNNKPTSNTSSLWSERKNAHNLTNGDNEDNFHDIPVDQNDNLFLPKRSTPGNKSFSYNTSPKPIIEKSSGSFGSVSYTPEKKINEVPAKPKQRVSSFLHTSPNIARKNTEPPPPPPAEKPPMSNGVPRKLPIPREKLSMMPPIKTSKPATVVLPRGRKSALHSSPPISMTSRPLPPPGSRDRLSTPLPPPPPGSRDLIPAPNFPPSLPSRDLPPGLPARPLPSPNKMPLPPPPDDIYDDPGEELPSLPSTPSHFPAPLMEKETFEEIPTWDDEADEDDAIYDETPDEPFRSPRANIPVGFPTGNNSTSPIPEDEGEDTYEDFDEYNRLKKLEQHPSPQRSTSGSVASNDGKEKRDKKKKDSEKKEKDIRKKFKIEGEIIPDGHGVVKETCKGKGKSLSITAGENIDVIRMTDNPKGKWLVRNAQGDFGYVDSDKVTINIDQLRTTFGVGGRSSSVIGGGPSLIIPTMDEEESIYDAPPDEDVYEEL